MSTNDDTTNDESSSGFGDFCGFNLEDDLSEGSFCDSDELERPGKTYEYVNFVNPKYAEQKSSNHSDVDEEDSNNVNINNMKPSQSSKRDITYSNRSLLPTSPIANPPNDTIREDAEEDIYSGHIHNHSIHQPDILHRQDTASEIAADHGKIDHSTSILNEGRKQILNHRRINRRYVWKDAEKYDILCLIASPCVKPIVRTPISYQDLFAQQTSTNTSIQNMDSNTVDDLNVLATVDEYSNKKRKRFESNSWSLMFEKTKQTTKHKKNQKKTRKRKHKNKKTNTKNKKKQFNGGDSQLITASDSELLLKRSSKARSRFNLNRNRALDHNKSGLQHFDIKGFSTLLYDGVLCSIHQTARFLTLCGNVTNIKKNISGCKLLHFIGYAQNGKLLLESDTDVGLGEWFDPDTNKNILNKMTQCVVIQSPTHREVADIFLNKFKVKHVVAIKQPKDNFAHHISDFITQFYFALIESNTSIARAFRTALKLFEDENYVHQKYHSTIRQDFKLLPEDIDHELILFREGLFDNGKPHNYSNKLVPHNNLHSVRPFIGRWNDVYKVMNMIRDKKLSIICSDQPGYGRSAIVTMAARYLWNRSKFKGGVFHIKHKFNTKRITNLAELVLDSLDIAEIEGFNEINHFYKTSSHLAPHLLAVELLHKYVNRNDETKPICLILSDFDEIQFDVPQKLSFICALIDRFDEEIETYPDIGTRIVVTCLRESIAEIQYFMDHCYNKHSCNNNGFPPLPLPLPSPSTHDSIGGRVHSKSAPAPYDLNNYNYSYTGQRHKRNRLPMQYKRGHQIIQPLGNHDLVELFLQMLDPSIYKFKKVSNHKALLGLFESKPLRIKQIAEYVLLTFDDNLSRQQFQYDDNEEQDYGMVQLVFEDESDSDSEEDEDEEDEDSDLDLDKGDTERSDLELKLDQWSDHKIAPPHQRLSQFANHLNTDSALIASHDLPLWALSGSSHHRKRKSKRITKIISIRKLKSFDSSKSFRLSNANVSFSNLLKGPKYSNGHNDSVDLMPTIPSMRASLPADAINDQILKQDLSYNILPDEEKDKDTRDITTIVPSDDCHILLTKSTSRRGNGGLSSRHICVDMAFNGLDCQKAFIRQKIQSLVHQKSHTKAHFSKYANESMDYSNDIFPNAQKSFKKMPSAYTKLAYTQVSSLQNIASGVPMSYDSAHTRPKHTPKPKNVSFSHNSNNHFKTLSTKLSRPKLRLQNESIPIPMNEKRSSTATAISSTAAAAANHAHQESNMTESDECIDDKIKMAWPSLDAIVDGFKKIEKERIMIQSGETSNIQNNIIRFKNMEPPTTNIPSQVSKQSQQSQQSKPNSLHNENLHFQLNGMTLNKTPIITNDTARNIWYNAGGRDRERDTLRLEDIIIDFYNYWSNKTKNSCLKLDLKSIGPFFKAFNPNNIDTFAIQPKTFNAVWKWFECLCDIVSETKMFWNNSIATNHGFITKETAEQELNCVRPFGTFIIRFTAPKPNIVITYNDVTKQHSQSHNVCTHIELKRVNSDLYQYKHKKDKLKMWIQKVVEFQYIFTKKHTHSVHKNTYFQSL